MKKAVIDRFQGEYAILEMEEGFQEIDRKLLPEGAREGDCIIWENGEIKLDLEETSARMERIKALMDKLFK